MTVNTWLVRPACHATARKLVVTEVVGQTARQNLDGAKNQLFGEKKATGNKCPVGPLPQSNDKHIVGQTAPGKSESTSEPLVL